jgi:hypothetical protein
LKKLATTLIVLATLVQAFAYYTRIERIEPFMYEFYIMVWWSYVILADAALALKTKSFLIFTKRFPHLLILSVAFWCFFELLNLRMQNWFYVNVPPSGLLRLFGYVVAFGTVIPAIYVTYGLLVSVLPEIRTRKVFLAGYGNWAIPVGIICLVLLLLFPVVFFPLAWVFLALIIDGYNYRKGYRSFAADLEKGSPKKLVAATASGAICGFLWELWNYWAITKWIYTVPFFEKGKLFEMPALGYVGFALFAVETIAFARLFGSAPMLSKSRRTVSIFALLFSISTFYLIDRYTVFSHTALVEELSFLSRTSRDLVAELGAKTSHAISTACLSKAEQDELALVNTKGLGIDHATALGAFGIHTMDDVARLDQETLSSMLSEPNLRRIRVYLKAARDHQATASGY